MPGYGLGVNIEISSITVVQAPVAGTSESIIKLLPDKNNLWFLPLGGTGEIGMNLNLYGHDQQWLMVDCGVSFNEPLELDASPKEVVAADSDFIASRRDRLAGIVITHAHEDHLGALPYLWHQFRVPVYTTPFTAEMFRRKLRDIPWGDQVPIREVRAGDELAIGVFTVEWLPTTHSIPEPQALKISTPAGSVLHTGDWKIDADPVVGDRFDPQVFQNLNRPKKNQQTITALVGDSTNALKTGHSLSEADCATGLRHYIKEAQGRVVVSCFGSNIARLLTIVRLAEECGRYVVVLGRSLNNALSAAKKTGHWPEGMTVQDARYIEYLPNHEILVIATGSQGEPRAALSQLAGNRHRHLELEAGDTVLLSAITIPGNEDKVNNLVQQLKDRDIRVVQSETAEHTIHASGHPNQEELAAMYQWVQPKVAIPVHGEQAHIKAHGDIALRSGASSALCGKNGDLYQLAPAVRLIRGAVNAGRVEIDTRNIGKGA